MPIGYSNGDVKYGIKYTHLKLKGEVLKGCVHFGIL